MRHTDKAKFGAVAAAIALALGTTVTLAQQVGADEQRGAEHQAQPGQIQPQAGQPQPQLPEQQPGQVQQQPGQAAQQPARPHADESDGAQRHEPAGLEAEQQSAQSQQGADDLDQLSAEHENLGTFVEAVKAAGLADALTEGTTYTVFAPTDEAWESKDGKNVDELMRPENREELVGLLRAHIVADDVDMELASAINEAQTIDGGTVAIQSENGELTVGDAKAADTAGIEMDNLRIYPIDGVLAANNPQTGAFGEASREFDAQDRRPSDGSVIDSDVETPDIETPEVDEPQDLPEGPITRAEPQ